MRPGRVLQSAGGHGDVFVSAVVEARAWAAPGEEASRADQSGLGAAGQGNTALRSLPCQAGKRGPMRDKERGALTLRRDGGRCNGLYSSSEECRPLSGRA